jgi:hypothetical protein
MWEQIQALALSLLLLAAVPGTALAAEGPGQRDPSGMPKGSFSASCTCQVSGGVTLICYCANLQAKMFQTTLDLRNCPAPNDIKNCDGKLTCTTGASAQCPEKK